MDMLEKVIDSDLLTKNVAKQLNTVISKEDKKERRVLTVSEAELFLGEAQSSFYYNLFVLAIETGMRIGELCGVQYFKIARTLRNASISRVCQFRNGTACSLMKIQEVLLKWNSTNRNLLNSWWIQMY